MISNHMFAHVFSCMHASTEHYCAYISAPAKDEATRDCILYMRYGLRKATSLRSSPLAVRYLLPAASQHPCVGVKISEMEHNTTILGATRQGWVW